MAREIMRRSASDNKYLHRDFHASLNLGLEYLRRRFGDESVREYLRQFALAFYAPLKQALREKGLDAVKEHYLQIFAVEEALDCLELASSAGELTVFVKRCPAVAHIRAGGAEVSPLFDETTNTVMKAVCEDTPYSFELVSYDAQTGASTQRFFKRRLGQ